MSLVFLALGFILLTLGVSVLMLAAAFRTRGVRVLLAFGAFTVLYGAEELLRSHLLHPLVSLSSGTASAILWVIDYWVPVPALIYMELRRGPGWHRSLRLMWQAWIPLALLFTTLDAVSRRPGAWSGAYLPFIFVMDVNILAHLLWGRNTAGDRLGLQRLGAIALIAAVLCDELGGLIWPGLPVSLEPLGAVAFIGSMAVVTVGQFFDRERELAIVEHEMNTARAIQESILPGGGLTLPRLDIATRYLPMRGIAGDFFDFHVLDDNRVGVLVADVTGHGVPAALIASMVKVAFASQRDCAEHPGALLTKMNGVLSGHFNGQFVTAAYLFFDTATGELRYSIAGHPPPMLWRQATGGRIDLDGGGLLLGFDAAATYADIRLKLQAGDRILLYTDGVIEAEDGAGRPFGDARLHELLTPGLRLQADGFAGLLLEELRAWSRHRGDAGSFADDVTFIVVDVAR